MDTELDDINQENVRKAFVEGMFDLTYTNEDQKNEIATILRIAVIRNDTSYATAILDQIHDILNYDNGGGKILWHAMENGNDVLAQKLILAGADLTYRSRNGTNILHCFMLKQQTLVSLMIERGADINIADPYGNTILYMAVRERLQTIVETVGRLDIIYADEYRILKEAASYDDAVHFLPSLIKSSDITRMKTRARIALPIYLKVRKTKDRVDIDLVKYFIEAALAPQHTNSDVVEILKSVVQFRAHTRVVKILLDYIQMLNGKSEAVASLLCETSKHSQSTMSMLLIQKGANINYPTQDCIYPLHSACRNESLQNIHLLLSLGADLTVIDKDGRTPFSCMSIPNIESLWVQHKLVLRHLAVITSKKMDIDPNDFMIIKEDSRMRMYYDQCLKELWTMKRKRIYGDITFFCFFDKNLEELCSLSRHVNFLRTYYLNQKEGNISFPLYSMQIHHIFKMAVERKNILIARAKVYEEAISNGPPYRRISHVMHDITELDNFERKYYFRLYKLINNVDEQSYGLNLLH